MLGNSLFPFRRYCNHVHKLDRQATAFDGVSILQSDWLSSPLGESLLAQERALVSEVWQRVFGDHLLQIGSWGAPGYFLDGVRTRSCASASPGAASAQVEGSHAATGVNPALNSAR